VAADGERSLLGALVRFGISGALSVAIDVGTLIGLKSGAGAPLPLATAGGYAGGLIVNYILLRNWTFQTQADHRQTMTRYAIAVAFNLALTLLVVLGLTHLGLYYLASKAIAVAMTAVVNFTLGRLWVFKH
jgi:putative flippase GtrA